MQNHYTHSLQEAIIKGPYIKTTTSKRGMCIEFDNTREQALQEQLALYLQGKGRLQC